MKLNKNLKNQKGVALIVTIIVLMVLMILFGASMTYLSANITQVKKQENLMKAHYVALTGINIASNALFEATTDGTLLDQHFKDSSPAPLTDTVVMTTGNASITMSAVDISGERWVKIESKGDLNDADTSKKLVLRINADTPAIQEWDSN